MNLKELVLTIVYVKQTSGFKLHPYMLLLIFILYRLSGSSNYNNLSSIYSVTKFFAAKILFMKRNLKVMWLFLHVFLTVSEIKRNI